MLEELNDKDDRSAYYECVLVAILPNGKIISAEGKTYGHILEKNVGQPILALIDYSIQMTLKNLLGLQPIMRETGFRIEGKPFKT